MKGDSVTVEGLIPAEFKELPGLLRADVEGRPLAGISENLLGFASTEIVSAVRDELKVDVWEWLARGWCTVQELRKYKTEDEPTDGTAGKAGIAARQPGSVSLVTLGEHTLSCVGHPVVTITVGPHRYTIDRFALELEAVLHAASLVIRDGFITGIQGVDGRASATLKFGEHALHTAESRAITLPGKIRFEEPGYRIK